MKFLIKHVAYGTFVLGFAIGIAWPSTDWEAKANYELKVLERERQMFLELAPLIMATECKKE